MLIVTLCAHVPMGLSPSSSGTRPAALSPPRFEPLRTADPGDAGAHPTGRVGIRAHVLTTTSPLPCLLLRSHSLCLVRSKPCLQSISITIYITHWCPPPSMIPKPLFLSRDLRSFVSFFLVCVVRTNTPLPIASIPVRGGEIRCHSPPASDPCLSPCDSSSLAIENTTTRSMRCRPTLRSMTPSVVV